VGRTPAVRAVVFDFGGVLITSITNQIGGVAERHGLPMRTMLQILMGPHESGDHPWHRAERGELAVADIQAGLQPYAEPHGIVLAGDEIDALMRPGGYTVVRAMNDKVAELRDRGFATALLTNTFAEFRPTMERDIRFADFTCVVESFAVGSRKPEPGIYEAAQAMLGVAADEIVYLDDFEQNVDAARALGWRVVHVGPDPLAALPELESVLA
jgi:putative hydrolase of the HAD superfamily